MQNLDGLDSLPEAQTSYCRLMGHQDKDMDVESLQKSGRRRGSCLDVFIVVSIIFLFVAVTAGAAGGVMVVMELRSELKSQRPSFVLETSKLSGDTTDPTNKMQNFVYLEAISSELKTSTIQWDPAHVSSVGSNFVFDAEQHSLKAKRAGTYFMYVNLNLTCTYECNAGLLSVRVNDKLTCEVQLPEVADSTPVGRKCWTVSQLEGQILITQMTVPKAGLKNWKLELNGSGFGMFLVD